MSEVTDAFRRIERPNVRTNTSVQSFHCALRSFAQACLQRMEQQLYRVKVRRIRWQVAEACTNSLDRLFHTCNLVEGDVVDHHNVPALERWDQTLLYVSQEGLSIHGSFDRFGAWQAACPRQPQRAVPIFRSPWHHHQKKVCGRQSASAPTSPARADAGFGSKAFLIRPTSYLSTRRQSPPTCCGSTVGTHAACAWSAMPRWATGTL